MTINLVELKAEIINDPQGLGYSQFITAGGTSSNHIAALLNAPNSNIQIDKGGLIPSRELIQAIDQDEYDVLSDRKLIQWQTLVSSQEVDLQDERTKNQITSIFGPVSLTRTSVFALTKRDGSRSEELFNINSTRVNVSQALLG